MAPLRRAVLVATFCLARATIISATSYDWAQPRTDWPGWWKVHGWYVEDAAAARQSGAGIDLIFYGDSITQCWRFGEQRPDVLAGQSLPAGPQADSVCAGAPGVFRKHFGQYNAKVFGIGGDQTPQLMYRLLHGEGPAGLRTKVAVLLIGTNDLGYALDKGADALRAVTPVAAAHARAIAAYLASYGAEVVLLGLTQRGNWHERGGMFRQPSVFTPSVDYINAVLREYAAGQPQVHYVYCGDSFLTNNGTEIDRALMPDALHPSAAGFELLAQCIEPLVARLMGGGAAAR